MALAEILQKIFTVVVGAFAPLLALVLGYYFSVKSQQTIDNTEEKVKKAESEVRDQPEKAKPAWDLARANLDLYFERNRAQVGQVFVVAIIIMGVGFGFVLMGVYLALQKQSITPPLVAAISGIITQFIGATFMVIYRSTMSQANEFMTVLQQINTVGMAVQVLDTIPESELKNDTRAHIVDLLLSSKPTRINTVVEEPKPRVKAKGKGA